MCDDLLCATGLIDCRLAIDYRFYLAFLHQRQVRTVHMLNGRFFIQQGLCLDHNALWVKVSLGTTVQIFQSFPHVFRKKVVPLLVEMNMVNEVTVIDGLRWGHVIDCGRKHM
jgi:hypothetical protein